MRPLGRPRGLQLVPIIVMLALVTSPYLGFGTSSRFTMFSGLRTEGAGSNHLFMPSTHLIDSQSSSLVVIDANGASPVLENAAENRAAIPLAQLREILQDPDVKATFETRGRQGHLRRAGRLEPTSSRSVLVGGQDPALPALQGEGRDRPRLLLQLRLPPRSMARLGDRSDPVGHICRDHDPREAPRT